MAKPAIKRNKAAARSCVILGTVLAGTAIWFSLPNTAKPASQNSAIVPAISSSAAASTISSTNPVTAQSTAAASSAAVSTISSSNPVITQSTAAASSLPQQQVIPRLRTRGS